MGGQSVTERGYRVLSGDTGTSTLLVRACWRDIGCGGVEHEEGHDCSLRGRRAAGLVWFRGSRHTDGCAYHRGHVSGNGDGRDDHITAGHDYAVDIAVEFARTDNDFGSIGRHGSDHGSFAAGRVRACGAVY